MIYKVSFVVQGGTHPGGIQNLDERPQVGDKLELGSNVFEIIEVLEDEDCGHAIKRVRAAPGQLVPPG